MPAFFSSELNDKTSRIRLSNEELHHLAHVFRHKTGDTVKINSGKGWTGKGVILSTDKLSAIIEITEVQYTEKPKSLFAIAFSLLKSKNDEFMLEKVTELGVNDLYPITACNSIRNPSANTITRFEAAALSAIKQCDNPWLPQIHDMQTLEQFVQSIRSTDYIPVVASENRPDYWIDTLDMTKNHCFIIGPEGGFADKEKLLFEKSGIPAISVSAHILRAETAGISIAAQYNLLRK